MNEKAYQAMTLVVVVLGFDFLERRHPGFPLNRQRELPLNIMALLIVIAGGELWKTLLVSGLNAFSQAELFLWATPTRSRAQQRYL